MPSQRLFPRAVLTVFVLPILLSADLSAAAQAFPLTRQPAKSVVQSQLGQGLNAPWTTKPEEGTNAAGPSIFSNPCPRCQSPPAGPSTGSHTPVLGSAAILTGTSWVRERVDAPRIFRWIEDRSLALDSNGLPHIAYGQDFLYYAWLDGTTWHLETVDDLGQVGYHAALALDAADKPHISYYDQGNGLLKYAHFDGVRWQIQVVDDVGGGLGYSNRSTSIGIDSSGYPHIGYLAGDDPSCSLRYARYDGVSWQIEIVENSNWFGWSLSLALDPADLPHMSYVESSASNDLKYAYHDGSTWHIQILDSDLSPYIRSTSLALDSAGHPHIGYSEDDQDDLKYAYYNGSTWQIETVDNVGYTGPYPSIALDSLDLPHIIYWGDAGIKYAHHDGTQWQIETAIPNPHGDQTSLALDSADHPHISYYEYDPDLLRYAQYDGTSWQIETVDTASRSGEYNDLALDAAGHPHISYCVGDPIEYTDWPCNSLKYIYYDGLAWHAQTVDAGLGQWAGHTSLALDAAGLPHISYVSGNSDVALNYAYYSGTTWITETVEAGLPPVSGYTSLGLDAAGHPHISYFVDWPDTELRYAYHDGTSWQIEVVDAVDGQFPSLALDKFDRPHISYKRGGLRYAYHNGTSWQIQTVDNNPAQWATSLTLDGNDLPHIAYYEDIYFSMQYAYHDGTSWHIEQIEPNVGNYTRGSASLTLDSSNHPHISYYDNYQQDLKYAYHDGTTWQIENLDNAGIVGQDTALALDGQDRPYISYYDVSNGDLKLATTACRLLTGAQVYGPNQLPSWTSGVYTASYSPITASVYVTFTWDNGDTGPIAVYSWARSGVHTVTVTASNPCGAVQGTFSVTVLCEPVAGATVEGPANLPAGRTGVYTASFAPFTASLPVTYTWDNGRSSLSGAQAGTAYNFSFAEIDGLDSATAIYSWTVPGSYTLTVTATNACGQVSATYTVDVFCQPVEEVSIAGPVELLLGETGLYSATFVPITASLPLTFTWNNGSLGSTAAYSWTVPGNYTLTVTAANACGQVSATYTVDVFCQPVEEAAIAGPVDLLVGEEGVYSASYAPPTATLPVSLTWSGGQAGSTTTYSWTWPGVYPIGVTATNLCSQVPAVLTVTVCQPLEGVEVTGPGSLKVGEPGLFTATYTPLTASQPLTITWSNGAVGPCAIYSWTTPGSHTVTVTAANDCALVSATYVVDVVCLPVEEMAIAGPVDLLVGEEGVYSVSYTPPTATWPVTLTWNNGSVGSNAVYRWTWPGVYTIGVTATNPCSQVPAVLTVTVCQPLEGVEIHGPGTLRVWQEGLYTATYGPISATLPVTLTWDNGVVGFNAVYSWTTPGTYTLSVTGSNACGWGSATLAVRVIPYRVYLPLVVRGD